MTGTYIAVLDLGALKSLPLTKFRDTVFPDRLYVHPDVHQGDPWETFAHITFLAGMTKMPSKECISLVGSTPMFDVDVSRLGYFPRRFTAASGTLHEFEVLYARIEEDEAKSMLLIRDIFIQDTGATPACSTTPVHHITIGYFKPGMAQLTIKETSFKPFILRFHDVQIRKYREYNPSKAVTITLKEPQEPSLKRPKLAAVEEKKEDEEEHVTISKKDWNAMMAKVDRIHVEAEHIRQTLKETTELAERLQKQLNDKNTRTETSEESPFMVKDPLNWFHRPS